MKLLDKILRLLYPPQCYFCGCILDREDTICESCKAHLRFTDGADRVQTGAHFTRCYSCCVYNDTFKQGFRRYKFLGHMQYSKLFGTWMADVLRVSNEPPFDLITWVPLHPIRKWRRGYDQAELLTREIANAAEVSATRTLRKVRYTRAQSRTLAKFRQQNVADVYRVISPSTVQGRRILLIDDVITTGSTLENAAAALRRAGAAQVICLTLARSSYDI